MHDDDENSDVPPRLLAAINKLYENTRARVITPEKHNSFKSSPGYFKGTH